jgi:hypothetical protein
MSDSLATMPSGTLSLAAAVMTTGAPGFRSCWIAERERHATHRPEQVDGHRVCRGGSIIEHRLLEEERRTTTRHLHRPISDFAHLELRRHRLPNADELARLFDGGNEIGE